MTDPNPSIPVRSGEFMTPGEVAAYLAAPTRCVLELVKARRLRAVRINDRVIRIPRAEVYAFVRAQLAQVDTTRTSPTCAPGAGRAKFRQSNTR